MVDQIDASGGGGLMGEETRNKERQAGGKVGTGQKAGGPVQEGGIGRQGPQERGQEKNKGKKKRWCRIWTWGKKSKSGKCP